MKQVFGEIKIKTNGQDFYNFTESTLDWIDKQKIQNGILNFVCVCLQCEQTSFDLQ